MNNLNNETLENVLDLNKLNREQKLAVFMDRHTFISANAGSGKTSVLIKKYLYELLTNPIIEKDPENIVAITFTKKAASEMTKRVYFMLEDIINNQKLRSWGLKKREFQNIYRNLSKSKISTIHSFCSSIIKEYPIESKLVPGYKESDGSDLKDIKDEILNNLLKEIIRNKDTNKDEYEYLKKYGIFKLTNELNEVYFKREYISDDKFLTESLYEEYLDDYKRYLISQIEIILEVLDYSIQSNSGKIENDVFKTKSNKESKISTYNLFLSKISKVRRLISFELNEIDFRDLALSLYDLMLNEKIGKSFVFTLVLDDKNIYSIDKGKYVKHIEKIIEDITNIILDEEFKELYIEENNIFLGIAKRYLNEIEKYKYEENIIDFDDILTIADKLLDDERILEDVRKNIKLLMVDEFQDTSDVQFSIVKKIVGDGNLDDIKLVIVGDEKQSIYGFRNAEIGVFKESKELVKELNDPVEKYTKKKKIFENEFVRGDIKGKDDENLGVVELKTSYRMEPYLTSFLNELNKFNFDLVDIPHLDEYFNKSIFSKYKTNYQEFVYGMKESKFKDDYLDKIKIEIDEYIEPKKIKDYDDEDNEVDKLERVKHNARAAVIRVIKLLKSGVEPEEIAIISRVKSTFDEIKKLLDKFKIPNVVHAKYNLFERREIKDIYLYLKFIEDPNDDLNFAGLLKSYFFNYNDSEILNLTEYSEGDSLYEKFLISQVNYSEKNKKTAVYLENVLENNIIFDFVGLLNYLIANSYWEKTIEIIDKEKETEESIDLLIDNVLAFHENYSSNLSETLDYINSQINSEEKEQQEDVNIQEGKINILTIHGSKGLEFKNVILIDLHKTEQMGGLTSLKYSKHFKFPSIKVEHEKIKSFGLIGSYYDIENKYSTLCELVRLFYVALSRAEEGLYLVSLQNNVRDSFSNVVKSFLSGVEVEGDDNEHLYTFKDREISVQYKELQRLEYVSYKIRKNIYQANYLDEDFVYTGAKDSEIEKIDASNEIDIIIQKEDFTATKFKNYNTYKSEYFQRYILGVPDFRLPNKFENTDFEDKPIQNATEKGIIVHFIMENINQWLNVENELDVDKVNELLDECKVKEKHRDYYFDVLNYLISSMFFKKYSDLKGSFISELSLKIPIEKSYLSCKIDLCFRVNDDTIEIWDWKTDKITNDKEYYEKIESYEYQLKSYIYSTYYYFKQPKKIITKLLFLDKLNENDSSEDWVYTKEYSHRDISNIKREIEKSLKKVNRLNFGIE